MANSAEFIEHLEDMLAPLGGIDFRSMFGGHGAFRDGVMFALVAGDTLYLRTDDHNRGDFEAAGMAAFGRMPYYEAPAEAMDDRDELVRWGRGAVDASLRAKAAKPKPKGKRKPAP